MPNVTNFLEQFVGLCRMKSTTFSWFSLFAIECNPLTSSASVLLVDGHYSIIPNLRLSSFYLALTHTLFKLKYILLHLKPFQQCNTKYIAHFQTFLAKLIKTIEFLLLHVIHLLTNFEAISVLFSIKDPDHLCTGSLNVWHGSFCSIFTANGIT